ncbi:DUF2141 domain-containing protein [Pseudoalteromonas sp. 2CM28B]|uniref:DUF2141 domain-containing protein n=1 Tax=Pseudoalteromonas sp. 2CM28B TaxID=2929851 RepID=UPI0020BE1A59|nr:DUF2141 domain-containing protein [Pseudoalteromonas sp. 2CM28B]MCK8133428.1 DUF2141 domain-containing protein [Pseudoalteromonas sp. 2CM28B]
MKKFIGLLAISLMMSQSFAKERHTLKLSFAKFKQVTGTVHYQILDCSNVALSWQELPNLVTQEVVVSANSLEQSTSLQAGSYCVRFFQDLNGNGELDLAASSIPKEPVGFSNNPNLMFGQPSPEDAVFEFSQNSEIQIKVNNKKRR